MSKVTVEMDTITDEITVKVDGEELDDVNSVSFYCYTNYEQKDICEVSINMTEDAAEQGGLRKYTTLIASKQEQATAAAKEGKVVGKLGDLVKIEAGKPLHANIAELINKYRR